MNKTGMIGCGSMGAMLLNRFLAAGVISADRVAATTLPAESDRLTELKREYPGIHIPRDNRRLAAAAERVWICVRPLEVKGVLEEIADHLQPDTHLISIAAAVSIENLESVFPGKITRVVPSITSTLCNGISLVCHNRQVNREDVLYLEKLLETVGTVKTIDEKIIDPATNLTSTAPGLIAAILGDFVESGMKWSRLPKKELEEIVIALFHRMSALACRRVSDLVHTAAWIPDEWAGIDPAQEGDTLLKKSLPVIFTELFDATLARFEDIDRQVSGQFRPV